MKATIPIKSNLVIKVYERGKCIKRVAGHNIWLDVGRDYLAQLIAYQSFLPTPTPYVDQRIRYMGFGVGGTRQLALPIVNNAPILTAYPGTNSQTDIDPTVSELERPVRISGTNTAPPYNPADVWLTQVQAPPTFPGVGQVRFECLISGADISYAPYTTVPLSEIGLFRGDANVNIYNNQPIAYDTFDTLSKTNAFDLNIEWTVRFLCHLNFIDSKTHLTDLHQR